MPPHLTILGEGMVFLYLYISSLFTLMNKKELIPFVWAWTVMYLGGFTACDDDEPMPPDSTPVVPEPEPLPSNHKLRWMQPPASQTEDQAMVRTVKKEKLLS